MLKVFLSHNSSDQPLVEKLAFQLRDLGFDPWLDKWDLIPGGNWQESLEQALINSDVCLIVVGNHGEGPWHKAEMRVALDRSVTQQGLRVIPVLLPGVPEERIYDLPLFLQAYTGVKFFQSVEEPHIFARLVAGIRNEKPGSGENCNDLENPYRGLQYFDVEHAPFFFGRSEVTQLLLKDLVQTKKVQSSDEVSAPRFLAIIGASGSGKSSLARAGLLASLKYSEGSNSWLQLIFKPGERPLQSLAVAINAHEDLNSRYTTRELIKKFNEEPKQLHDFGLEWLHGDHNRYLVILVDQFEEIFTLSRDSQESQALLDNLLEAASDPTGKIIILLTLRADFYANCSAYPQLSRYLERQQCLLNPLMDLELREAISSPARSKGCELELGLIEVILHDVHDQPGSLPLLQFALMQLWEQRTSSILRLDDYQKFGGLTGALEQRANQVFASFSPELRDQCRFVFRRLVQPGDGVADTRRRSNVGEFEDQEKSNLIIKTLTDARLLTVQQHNGIAFVEVSHEALIREWSQLQDWLDEDREQLRLQHQVSNLAQEWVQNNEEASWLLSGSRLETVKDWGRDGQEGVNCLEQRFILASIRQRDSLRHIELKRQRNLKWLVGVLAVFCVTMLMSALLAVKSEKEAQLVKVELEKSVKEANFNLSKVFEEKALSTLAKSESLINRDSLRSAFLFALGAGKLELPKNKKSINPLVLGKLSLGADQDINPQLYFTDTANLKGGASSIALHPNGKTIATVSKSRDIKFWDVLSGKAIKLLKGHQSSVQALAFNPSGKILASASWDGTIRLWDASSGKELKVFAGHKEYWLDAISFSSNGKFLASAGDGREIHIWDVQSGKRINTLNSDNTEINALAYSLDGRVLAAAGEGKAVELWDVVKGVKLRALGTNDSNVYSIVFSPDGKVLASAGEDKVINLWDTSSWEKINTLKGHSSTVYAVVFSFDGKVLASAGGKDVYFWSSSSGEQLKTPRIEGASFATLAYSSNGNLLATGSWSGRLRLWDIGNSEELTELSGHSAPVLELAYSPDGKTIASSGEERVIRLRSTINGKESMLLNGHTNIVTGLVYSPSGKIIASSSMDGTIRLWSSVNGEEIKVLEGHKGGASTVSYSQNGKVLASGGLDSMIRLWDTTTGEKIKALEGHSGMVHKLTYSPNGRFFASAGEDKTVILWDASNGEKLKTFDGHSNRVITLEFARDSKTLASVSGNMIHIWDISSGKELNKLEGHDISVFALSYSPNGTVLASAGGGIVGAENTIRLWDTTNYKELKTWQGHESQVHALEFSPNGKVLASGSKDNTVRFWDNELNEAPKAIKLPGVEMSLPFFEPSALVISPDNKTLAAISNFRNVSIFDIDNGRELKTMLGHDAAVGALTYNSSGNLLASASVDRTVRLWDVLSGKELRKLIGHEGGVNAVAFRPDGKILASGSGDKTIRLWNTDSGEQTKILEGHEKAVISVAYSPDGKVLASASWDQTIRMWDSNSGEQLKILDVPSSLHSLSYSPDGTILASSSNDNTIRLWDAVTGEELISFVGTGSLTFSPDGETLVFEGNDDTVRLWDISNERESKALKGYSGRVGALAYSPDGETLASLYDNKIRLWRFDSAVHRLLYDFSPKEVEAALNFLWGMKLEGLEVVKTEKLEQTLFPNENYHINWTDETLKYRSLLDVPKPNETKLDQLVRWLDGENTYDKP